MTKLIIAVFIIMIVGVGCATVKTSEQFCIDYQPSWICDAVNPLYLDKTMLAINYSLLRKGVYTKEEATSFINMLRTDILESKTILTGTDLVFYLNEKIKSLNQDITAALFILGPDISLLDRNMLLQEGDYRLIDEHLRKQLLLISIE